MKKIIRILIVFALCIPMITKADTVDYDITNYYINADILENGNLKVTELIVLDGTFNGYIRDITYKNSQLKNNGYENNQIYNASNLKIEDISAKKVKSVSFDTINESGFTTLTYNKSANGGYVESKITNGNSYKMYFKSNNEKVAFKITYILEDVLVLHKDVAELYWNFIGSDYDDAIRDLQIKVNLPNRDASGNFRVWAHGEMSGEINAYDNTHLIATVKKLSAHDSVDIRATFDASLLNEYLVTKKTENKALEGIIEVETKRAEEMNEKRNKVKRTYYTLFGISIVYYIALIVSWIYIYFKYDKEYKSNFTNEYNREFIDDYNVEVIDYLMHKSITPNAMSASIMNLIYKKVITVEEIPTNKNKKEYKFTLISTENLNETEKYLIDFLFQTIGKENTFTSKELKDYAKSTKTCEKFSSTYMKWKNKVVADGKKQEFYETHPKPIAIGIFFILVAALLEFLLIIFNAIVPITFFTLFAAVFFLMYTILFNRRTKKGNDHYVRWRAFKKFLQDFGTFETKELPEIVLWERYMVYATIFGLAEKVAKTMNVKIKELEAAGVYTTGYYPTFSDWYFYNSLNNIFTSTISSNSAAVTSLRANSSSSSGSGFGGGFSSGGGFGGGGGGGRGF